MAYRVEIPLRMDGAEYPIGAVIELDPARAESLLVSRTISQIEDPAPDRDDEQPQDPDRDDRPLQKSRKRRG